MFHNPHRAMQPAVALIKGPVRYLVKCFTSPLTPAEDAIRERVLDYSSPAPQRGNPPAIAYNKIVQTKNTPLILLPYGHTIHTNEYPLDYRGGDNSPLSV